MTAWSCFGGQDDVMICAKDIATFHIKTACNALYPKRSQVFSTAKKIVHQKKQALQTDAGCCRFCWTVQGLWSVTWTFKSSGKRSRYRITFRAVVSVFRQRCAIWENPGLLLRWDSLALG